jgi:hypothetical protein
MVAYFKYSRWDGHPARQLLTGETPVPPGAIFQTALAVSEYVTVFMLLSAKSPFFGRLSTAFRNSSYELTLKHRISRMGAGGDAGRH